MTGKERILAALRGEPADSLPLIPISMMIAADLIGRPYRDYVLDADVHVFGQIAFAERYDIDHVSAISCPTTEAADLGATIIYYDNQPPAIDESRALLADKAVLQTLKVVDPGSGARMMKRLRVLEEFRRQVGDRKLIEGWVEGPVAEASDLRGINVFMMDFFDDPQFANDLFDFIFENAMNFAKQQKAAGADIMGVGDAASSLLGPDLYREFVWERHKAYVAALHDMGLLVRLHICGNVTPLIPMLKDVGADILDLDHMNPMRYARETVGPTQLLSSNIDPVSVLLNGDRKLVESSLTECLRDAGPARFAVCAGCEIPRGTRPENIDAMRQFARSNAP